MKKLIIFALILAVMTIVAINFTRAQEPNIPGPNEPNDPNAPNVISILLAEEPNIVEPNAMEPNAPAPTEPNV